MCDLGCCSSIADDISAICAKHKNDKRYLIPILHDIQHQFGFISPEIMEEIAERLSVTVSHVHGVTTFYSLFYTKPHGKYVIRLCDSPPCHIEGSQSIRDAISERLGIAPGETTSDGVFSYEIVSCMGLCGVAPAMMIDDDVYGNLKLETIPQILAKYRSPLQMPEKESE